jgi:hypothetical protein
VGRVAGRALVQALEVQGFAIFHPVDEGLHDRHFLSLDYVVDGQGGSEGASSQGIDEKRAGVDDGTHRGVTPLPLV